MTQELLFNMHKTFREDLIDRQKFYIEVAKNRLLAQFPNIEEEADKYANEQFNEARQRIDPEKFDDDAASEWAQELGEERYLILDDIVKMTQLSVIAGMYHEWEKQLRDWMTRELPHHHAVQGFGDVLWDARFDAMVKFLEDCDWSIKKTSYYKSLDRCRLIVNVYKHGNGKSFEGIRKKHPEFIKSVFDDEHRFLELKYADYTNLVVEEKHIDEFSNAIIEFWKNVPENIYEKHN